MYLVSEGSFTAWLVCALHVLPNATDTLLQSHTFSSVHVAVFNYMPIEINPKERCPRSKCYTEEGESKGCENFMIFMNTSTPYTEEYLSTRKALTKASKLFSKFWHSFSHLVALVGHARSLQTQCWLQVLEQLSRGGSLDAQYGSITVAQGLPIRRGVFASVLFRCEAGDLICGISEKNPHHDPCLSITFDFKTWRLTLLS